MTDWSAGTFRGNREARELRLASLGARRAMDWLESALRLAADAGVLAAVRRERQARCEADWGSAGHVHRII
jgi:hypothetical protein